MLKIALWVVAKEIVGRTSNNSIVTLVNWRKQSIVL